MQRKRGDGGRFFSPKTKDEIALTLGQVRNSKNIQLFFFFFCCITFSFFSPAQRELMIFCLPALQTDAAQAGADEPVTQMIRVQ